MCFKSLSTNLEYQRIIRERSLSRITGLSQPQLLKDYHRDRLPRALPLLRRLPASMATSSQALDSSRNGLLDLGRHTRNPIHPISLPVRQGSLNKFLQRFDTRQHIHLIAAQRNRSSAHPPSASEPNDNIGQRGQSCVRRTTPSKHVRKEFRQVSATFPHRSWQRQTRRDLCRQHWGGRPNVEQ
jgi:predicted DNA-binding transcriptional regulator AlpA